MDVNKLYNGFLLKEKHDVKEIESIVYVFEHKKTKARLLFIENDDNDKAFSVGFRTPCNDDTGVSHILEHSVLCGSKNFNLKDPFAQLAKSTINTFLNAFTFPDKTVYPFSTTNGKEFEKMMNVYLDAVFFPNIYDRKEIFLQEGWRYNLVEENGDKKLEYVGVVYNEMKGAMSNPDRLLDSYTLRSLFPNTNYGNESGGDPVSIPNLTYEQFIDFHRRFYHPSNSYIMIYGNRSENILRDLDFIDKNYLSHFDYLEVDSTIGFQDWKEDDILEKEFNYPVSDDEKNIEKRFQYNVGFVIDKATNSKTMLGFDILGKILMEYESSPLRKALVEADLADDVTGGFFEDMTYQPLFNVSLKNSSEDKKEKFKEILYKTLTDLAENGIDKDLIKATINKKEFALRERKFIDDDHIPTSILLFIKIYDSMLYDGDPLLHVRYTKNLEEIKEVAYKGYFEGLIKKYLIDNKHACLLTLRPDSSCDLNKENEKKLLNKLNSATEKELEEIKKSNANVLKFQEEEDCVEDMNKLKALEIKDIDEKPYEFNLEDINFSGMNGYYHKTSNVGIDYLNLIFDTRVIDQKDIQYLTILAEILHETRTKDNDYDKLSNLINEYIGEIDFEVSLIKKKESVYMPIFVVSLKYLSSNKDKVIEILNDIFNNVVFEKAKLLEVLRSINANLQTAITSAGHRFADMRLDSYVTQSGVYKDKIMGIDFYLFTKNILDDFENKYLEVLLNIEKVYEKVFTKNNVMISLACDENDINRFSNLVLKNKDLVINEYNFEINALNEAFKTSSQVNYVGLGYNFKELGYDYDASILVLRNFLRIGYLWENVRMKGGAYGAMADISLGGNFYLLSYRDPNIKNTLNVYKKFSNYLKDLDIDDEEIRKYIIGTISDFDAPLKLDANLKRFTLLKMGDYDYDWRLKERKDILETDLNKLRSFMQLTKDAFDKNVKVVIGNSSQIEKEGKDFNIVNL